MWQGKTWNKLTWNNRNYCLGTGQYLGTYWHGAMVTPYYNVLRQSKTGWNNEAGNQKCILHDEEKGRLWFSNESCKAKGEKFKHGGCTESFFTNYSSISHKHLTNIQSINCVVNGPMIFWTITMMYIHLNAILHVWSKCSNKNYTKKTWLPATWGINRCISII